MKKKLKLFVNKGYVIREEKMYSNYVQKRVTLVSFPNEIDFEIVFSDIEKYQRQFEIYYTLYSLLSKSKDSEISKSSLKNAVEKYSESAYNTLKKKNLLEERNVFESRLKNKRKKYPRNKIIGCTNACV